MRIYLIKPYKFGQFKKRKYLKKKNLKFFAPKLQSQGYVKFKGDSKLSLNFFHNFYLNNSYAFVKFRKLKKIFNYFLRFRKIFPLKKKPSFLFFRRIDLYKKFRKKQKNLSFLNKNIFKFKFNWLRSPFISDFIMNHSLGEVFKYYRYLLDFEYLKILAYQIKKILYFSKIFKTSKNFQYLFSVFFFYKKLHVNHYIFLRRY